MSGILSHITAVYLSDPTAGSNHENINVNATVARKYWKIAPATNVRMQVFGVRIFAAISGSISTYADFLGVTLTSDTEIRVDVVLNTSVENSLAIATASSFDFSTNHTYGLRSIGDALAGSVLKPFVFNSNPGCVAFDLSFQTEATPTGIGLNGYASGASQTADYLAVSHAANLSGLNFMKAVALVRKISTQIPSS